MVGASRGARGEDFRITGAARLKRLRRALPGAAEAAAMDAAERARALAVAAAPVDTGRLRGSIVVKRTENGAAAAAECPYAAAVEFGSVRAGAQPFMMPALEGARETFLESASKRAREALG